MPDDYLMRMNDKTSIFRRATLVTYLFLLLLILLWEGWLAPAPNAPPGIWLMLKSIPLLFPLRGLFRGRDRTYLLTTLLLMFYFADGVVLTYLHWPEGFGWHRSLPYAIAEWVLATACFALALLTIRESARQA